MLQIRAKMWIINFAGPRLRFRKLSEDIYSKKMFISKRFLGEVLCCFKLYSYLYAVTKLWHLLIIYTLTLAWHFCEKRVFVEDFAGLLAATMHEENFDSNK